MSVDQRGFHVVDIPKRRFFLLDLLCELTIALTLENVYSRGMANSDIHFAIAWSGMKRCVCVCLCVCVYDDLFLPMPDYNHNEKVCENLIVEKEPSKNHVEIVRKSASDAVVPKKAEADAVNPIKAPPGIDINMEEWTLVFRQTAPFEFSADDDFKQARWAYFSHSLFYFHVERLDKAFPSPLDP